MPNASRSHRTYSPETWLKVRDDFLGGMTGKTVCAKYKIAERTFWDHAHNEGWRLRDQDAPEPIDPEPDPDFADPDATPDHLADVCWRRMTTALGLGRFVEAARWEKFHRIYRTRACEMAEAAERARRHQESRVQSELDRLTDLVADFRRVEARVAGTRKTGVSSADPQSSQSSHTPLASDPPPDPNEPGIDRAERRRRLKATLKRTGKGGR